MSSYPTDFLKENWNAIFIIIIIIFVLIFVFSSLGVTFNDNKIVKKVVTIEGLKTRGQGLKTTIKGDGLCDKFSSQPHELNKKCNELSEENCNATSCCGWLNKEKCVAGKADGPTFRSNKGKEFKVISWDFMKSK
jgi:hypothetical protein